MSKLLNFFTGKRILEETISSLNGKITVVRDLAWGTHLMVDGITQSGGVVEEFWRSTLRKIRNTKPKTQNVLILGLGGGTIAKLVRKYWPEAKIIGVDIDPKMVELGKKYFGLNALNVDIKIQDAYKFVSGEAKMKSQLFDLVLVDLYVGDKFPKKFETEKFLEQLAKLLSDDSVAVFNRLYYREKRREAIKFGGKLEKVFSKVERFFPESNIMFICSQRV